ncbi:MAG: efflux RND transporter periplasmic adaptor subunit [Planctomycetaceae bacterium]|nr:efflux RND transporter periplasmic adaptor subunit [Planctomycetaceae bacterium]
MLHEISHAVVCRKYGGQVGALSLALILFAPLVAVDVSSAWKFRSKWQRLHVSLAGIYSDLMLAAGLLCLAGVAYSPVTIRFCYDFAWLLAGGTLLFNANPLMRFDGYYVLSDLINIPNLYEKGSQRVQGLVYRAVGVPAPEVISRDLGESKFVMIYGLLAVIWRVFVSLGLCLTAIAMFHEIGVVIAALGLFGWYVRPTARFARDCLAANRWNAFRLARVGFLGTAFVALIGFGLLSLPCPWNVTAPALVDFPEDSLVRVETSGWVRALHVEVGGRVERGTLLMELENEDLVAECAALKLSIEKCRIKERKALSTGDTSTMQIEQEKRHAIDKQLQFKTASLDGLRVLAPVSGHLVAVDWPQLQGTYLKEGQQVCVISDERRKRLLVSVAQPDSKQFSAGSTIHFRIGQDLQSLASVSRLTPRATVIPVSDAFCSPAGGPLPAVPGDDPKTWDFLEPRFAAYVDLPESVAERVFVGQRAQVSSRVDRSLLDAAGQQLRLWSRELIHSISR